MADDGASAGATSGQGHDDTLAKYKRLLSMARSSLEANQATLAARDQQISQLVAALEEERNKRMNARVIRDDDGLQQYPRRIICRVDVESQVWILFEFENAEDDWKIFTDEMGLQDYLKRIPGIPLVCPTKCLSAEESAKLIEESKKKVDKVMEEFRRYKVRTEIALKQKEADHKSFLSSSSTISPGNNGLWSQSIERALSLGVQGGGQRLDEVQRLKLHLQEQEAKWKQSYEKLSKELDMLKTKGAESVVAAQWRGRYETCAKEREELTRKLQIYSQLSSEVMNSDKSLEELYIELAESSKGLRRRLLAFIQHYSALQSDHISIEDMMKELGSVVDAYRINHHEVDDVQVYLQRSAESKGTGEKGRGMAESKVQYVRQMMFQYLLCQGDDVKQHIEAALMAIFRFTEEEKSAIESKRKELDASLTIDSTFNTFSNFLGSFAST